MIYTSVRAKADVTDEILDAGRDIIDGWYSESRIDTEEFIDRLDETPLEDGTYLDLGEFILSPALKYIISKMREYKLQG